MEKEKRGLFFSVLILLTVIGITLWAGYAVHKTFKDDLHKRWFQQLDFAAEMTSGTLENYFCKLSGALLIASGTPTVKEILIHGKTNNEYCPLEAIYKLYANDVNTILLLDNNNRVLKRFPCRTGWGSNAPCPEPHPDFQPDKQVTLLSDVFINRAGLPTISLSCPVIVEGEQVGVLKWIITLDKLSKILTRKNDYPEDLFIQVFDISSGVLLIPAGNSVDSAGSFDGSVLKEMITNTNSGYVFPSFSSTNDEESILAGYHILNIFQNEWAVVVSLPYRLLNDAIRNNVIATILISFFAALMISLIILNILRLHHQKQIALRKAQHHQEMAKAAGVLQNERKLRLKATIDIKEAEQKRISRDLHDGLGQLLLAIRLKLHDAHQEHGGVERVMNMLDRALEEVKTISNHLHPPIFSDLGIDKVMEQLCRDSEAAMGCKVEYVSYGVSFINDPLVKSYIYRICQEALANAIKHSSATEVNVQLLCTVDHATFIIQDNGTGFNLAYPSGNGNGIANMRDRASLLDGTFEIDSLQGSGTTITVRIPLNSENGKK